VEVFNALLKKTCIEHTRLAWYANPPIAQDNPAAEVSFLSAREALVKPLNGPEIRKGT
jgi:hypothetical protein